MDPINNQISILYRLSQSYISKKLKVYKLNHSQIATLLFISDKEKVNQQDICRHLALDKGSVSSMVKKLEHNGFLKKVNMELDRRKFYLELTYKSKLILDQINEANHKLVAGILDGFTPDERSEISYYLERMKDNVELVCNQDLEKYSR
jgi:DNA-binding MarR family transcriptional regulator